MSLISSAVVALEKELEWYKQQNAEAKAVIAQLHRGYALPGEVTYIHPADFAEMVNREVARNDFFFHQPGTPVPLDLTTLFVRGVRYKQSVWMPKITKNFE